jgi:hypothetical protein
MPTTIEALLIAALVLAPGYIFTQIARRVIAHIEEPTDIRFLLTIISAGTAIHVLIFFWTVRIVEFYRVDGLAKHQWEAYAWAISTVFLIPIGLGVLAGQLSLRTPVDRVLDRIGLGYIDRMPSAWDYVMRREEQGYVRVHLKDNQGIVAGAYGDRSFGSLNSKRSGIFLEETWQLDDVGNFAQRVADTRGVWIAHEVMSHVEFLHGQEVPYGATANKREPNQADRSSGYGKAGRSAQGPGQPVPPAADSAAGKEE